MTRAAIYLRISLDATGEGLAVARQRQDCEAIARQRGWQIVEVDIDNSISASKINVARPAYQKLCDDFEAGAFDALVCYDLDRLTRQPRQLEDWIDAAEQRGLKIVTANGEADLTTDAGRLFARIKAAVARSEVERKSARQKRAHLQRLEQGRPPGGVRLTGYTTTGAIIVAEAASVLAQYEAYAAGSSVSEIAHQTGRAPSSVRATLTNPRYAGRMTYQGAETGNLGQWEAIVPPGLFDAVQTSLASARTTGLRHSRRALGSGLYLCGACGAVMSTSAGRYTCRACRLTRTGEPIDATVTDLGTAWLNRHAHTIIATTEGVGEVAEETTIANLYERIARLECDFDEDLIDARRYNAKLSKLETEIGAARTVISRARSSAAIARLCAGEADPGTAFHAAPVGVKQQILAHILTVHLDPVPRGRRGFDPNSIRITWHGPTP